jgi:hypothetical protein
LVPRGCGEIRRLCGGDGTRHQREPFTSKAPLPWYSPIDRVLGPSR